MFGNKLGPTARLSAGLALASASLAIVVSAARADPYSRYGEATVDEAQGVTVYSPDRYIRQPTTGEIVRMDRVSMTVPLGDLDLSTPYGARVAKARIVQAARQVCEDVDDAYPGSSDPPGGCYTMAVRAALSQAQAQAGYPIVAWGYR
jgi:UrcA family protein